MTRLTFTCLNDTKLPHSRVQSRGHAEQKERSESKSFNLWCLKKVARSDQIAE